MLIILGMLLFTLRITIGLLRPPAATAEPMEETTEEGLHAEAVAAAAPAGATAMEVAADASPAHPAG